MKGHVCKPCPVHGCHRCLRLRLYKRRMPGWLRRGRHFSESEKLSDMLLAGLRGLAVVPRRERVRLQFGGDGMTTETTQQEGANPNREIWREVEGDQYSPALWVTPDNDFILDVGGFCVRSNIRWIHERILGKDEQTQQLYALAKAARSAWDHPHIAEFTETGWSLLHPLKCRPNLQDCLVHRYFLRNSDDYSDARGRYLVLEERDGAAIHLGEKWTGEDPALALGTALAPFEALP